MTQQGVKPNINAPLSCRLLWLNFMFVAFHLTLEGLKTAE